MKKLKKEIISNPLYAEFIRENREILSGINRNILEMLATAEEQNRLFSGTIDELIKLADISTTMHLQYKNSSGDEEIFKLKSLLVMLKKNTMADTIHVETALYLAGKIENIINKTFTQIEPYAEKAAEPETAEPGRPDLQYRWFTFSRNGSWFIQPYKVVDIIGADRNQIFFRNELYYYEFDGSEYEIHDLMSSPSGNRQPPVYLLRFDRLDHLYASDENGKEIHASSDIVTPQLKKLTNHDNSGFAGRVRLFGTNYLLPEISRYRE